jgi:beta-N-acetylhexosaminidase
MKNLIKLFLLVAILGGLLFPPRVVSAQEPLPPAVEAVFNSMTAEERVGQLFLINFTGSSAEDGSKIFDLISNFHVGGVVLNAVNDNFVAAPDTPRGVYDLIARLQRIEWEDSNDVRQDPISGFQVDHAYIPLLIGIAQDGNGSPGDQILSGLTPIPSHMAIGASWNTGLAAQIGEIQGHELAALGFNFLLGPSLDVLDIPNPSGPADIGTNVFGGDPYWVGEMGRAYIRGLHSGSKNRLLVIPKHFPGYGGTNRLTGNEIPTVRKSLEQLKQIELAPFFAVTGGSEDPQSSADGLLVSHIRYQGLQGNIRATTRPISFDVEALDAILGIQQFTAWHSAGGLIVSDDLGTRAVKQFYTPGGGVFSAQDVVRDAFLAGNDLLYLGEIAYSEEQPDNYKTIISIASYFVQKYQEDTTFARRVDQSVKRILAAKYRLYHSVTIFNVISAANNLDELGGSADLITELANESASLISPDAQDLSTLLPSAPRIRERLVFLTGKISAAQCSACPTEDIPAINALQQAVIRLYGPEAENQTSNFLVSSYSLDTLLEMLDGLSPSYIENDINRSDWIILSITGTVGNQPAVLSRFLSERQDILGSKKIVLFSFGAPYYFDSTDISRLTAYYVLYSKQDSFIDAAARLLFKELKPVGASPVSIPGTGYDLISAMLPTPDQIIPLFIDLKSSAASTDTTTTPPPTAVPLFQIGDIIALRTGEIMDHNGHVVPDGTVVRFSMTLTGEGGGILQQVEAVTTRGTARASFGLDKPGLLEIHAVSEPAAISEVIQLDVSTSGPVAVTVVVPEMTPSAQEAVVPTEAITDSTGLITQEGFPRPSAWFIVMVLLFLTVGLFWWFGRVVFDQQLRRQLAFGALIGGLLAYNYLVLGLPGSIDFMVNYQFVGVVLVVFSGEVGGWLVALAWFNVQEQGRLMK